MKFLLKLLLVLMLMPTAFAYADLQRQQISGCTFSSKKGEADSLLLLNRRVAYVNASFTKRIRLDRRSNHVECRDTDGDGIDEVLGFSRDGSYSITQVRKVNARKLSSVCTRVRSLSRGEIYKSIASKHINDQRATSTSFITLRSTGAPKNNCLYVYDKAGNLIHKMGRYFPTGAAYSSRYYGGHGCGDLKSASAVASAARSRTGSPAGYITSGTGNCAFVPNMGSCFNSSAC
jgi:hypothetical protein